MLDTFTPVDSEGENMNKNGYVKEWTAFRKALRCQPRRERRDDRSHTHNNRGIKMNSLDVAYGSYWATLGGVGRMSSGIVATCWQAGLGQCPDRSVVPC